MKLHKQIIIAGCIYNHCIALHKRHYRLFGRSLHSNRLQKHLAKLKKLGEYAFWNLVGSQAIQDIAQRIDKGYRLFYRNLKHKSKTAPPSFRKVKKYKSFTLKQAGYKYEGGNKIIIQKQEYKFHQSREMEGTVKTLTVKRDALGGIYLYFFCEQEQVSEVIARTGKSVGFDFGLNTFLKASDGKDIETPLFFKQSSGAIEKANRKLSRKKKGSANGKLARLELARLHKKTTNQRKDFHFKLAAQLAREYATICSEDLNIKEKRGSPRSLLKIQRHCFHFYRGDGLKFLLHLPPHRIISTKLQKDDPCIATGSQSSVM
jgi:putative transposase